MNKKYIFLNTVKTPFGDVVKGEILTGRPFTRKPSPTNQGKDLNGLVFNFYENKDSRRFLDKTVDEIFFIPSSAVGEKGTIREARGSEIKTPIGVGTNSSKPSESVTSPILPASTPVSSNKMISFVVGALAGVIVGYVVINKFKK
jgi:hypothetical protein